MLKKIKFSSFIFIFLSILNWLFINFSFSKNGISGHLRVRNEQESLGECIESIIDFLDELIITYNDCTDNSLEIIRQKAKKYPNKIRFYEWKKHPIIISKYSNFGLRKCRYRWIMKVDADQIYSMTNEMYQRIVCSKKNVIFRQGGICPVTDKERKKIGFLLRKQITLLDNNKKKHVISNASEEPIIFINSPLNRYKRNKNCYWEWIWTPMFNKKNEFLGDCFVHLIYLKRFLFVPIDEIISYKDIDKTNVNIYFKNEFNWGLMKKFDEGLIDEIATRYKNRKLFWYELKEKDWNGKSI